MQATEQKGQNRWLEICPGQRLGISSKAPA